MTAFPASATHTPATFFGPQDADSLWKLVSTPHPLVGKAPHLGEALVNADMVAVDAVIAGLQAQQEERKRGVQRLIGQILVDQGQLSQDQLREVIASWLGDYVVHPGHLQPDALALALVPRNVAERESVLPLLAREDALVVAMADPGDRTLLDELRFLTQRRVLPRHASAGVCGAPFVPRAGAEPG